MIDYVLKSFSLFAGVFFLLLLLLNIYPNSPRFPWDLNIANSSIQIKIPIVTAIILATLLSFMFNFY